MQGRPRKLTEQDAQKEFLENKKTIKQIAQKFGITEVTVKVWFRKYGIKYEIPKVKFLNLKDRKIGRLTPKYRIPKWKGKKSAWFCECKCGNTCTVVTQSLSQHRTLSCGCFHLEKIFKGIGYLGSGYWYKVINGAKKRNLELSITIEDAWNLFLKQKGICALSGIEINLNRDCSRNWDKHTASLDRIDSSKGYIEGNIQWVHKEVNEIKGSFSDDELINWCERIYKHNERLCGRFNKEEIN